MRATGPGRRGTLYNRSELKDEPMTEPLMEGAPLIAPSSTDHPLYEAVV